MHAFANLRKLQFLDLSHNRLEQLHEDTFENNENLIELNLSHNNFMTLQHQPLFKSPSLMVYALSLKTIKISIQSLISCLQILELHECKIPQIYDNTFLHLPKLSTLDLSGNLMITLPKEPFVPLNRLRIIELGDNRWQCDSSSVRATINWMKKRIDTIRIEHCCKFLQHKYSQIYTLTRTACTLVVNHGLQIMLHLNTPPFSLCRYH